MKRSVVCPLICGIVFVVGDRVDALPRPVRSVEQCEDDEFMYMSVHQQTPTRMSCSRICPPENAVTDNELIFCANNCPAFDKCLRRTLPNSARNDTSVVHGSGQCHATTFYHPREGYMSCTDLCIVELDSNCGHYCPSYFSCLSKHEPKLGSQSSVSPKVSHAATVKTTTTHVSTAEKTGIGDFFKTRPTNVTSLELISDGAHSVVVIEGQSGQKTMASTNILVQTIALHNHIFIILLVAVVAFAAGACIVLAIAYRRGMCCTSFSQGPCNVKVGITDYAENAASNREKTDETVTVGLLDNKEQRNSFKPQSGSQSGTYMTSVDDHHLPTAGNTLSLHGDVSLEKIHPNVPTLSICPVPAIYHLPTAPATPPTPTGLGMVSLHSDACFNAVAIHKEQV